tara:strand:+ start:131 stop:328 length:198 start_codon:yes stop_codon:yes gene_type:complete
MSEITKATTVAESIARLNKQEIQMLAEIMVHKHIADDLDFLLLNAKAEALRGESSLANILFANKD